MTPEQFNSLPLEARSFIQNHAGCLACGNSASKLDKAYSNYLNSKKMATYQLFGGGINYRTEAEETGVLYNIQPSDTPFEIREKIRIAKLVRAVRPHAFMVFDEEAIEALLASLPDEEDLVIQLNPVVDAPVVDAPVVDAPVVDAPVVDAPVVDAPVVDAPVVDAPVVDAPVVDAPVVDAPVVDAPVASLGFDTKTASYEDLKAYAKANAIEVKGQSKKDYIAAIEASEELL